MQDIRKHTHTLAPLSLTPFPHTHMRTHRRNKALAQALSSPNSSLLTTLAYGQHTHRTGVLAIAIDQKEGIISFATNKAFEKILRSASDVMDDYYKRKVSQSHTHTYTHTHAVMHTSFLSLPVFTHIHTHTHIHTGHDIACLSRADGPR